MKVLVLGGDGFIGSHLVEELLVQGHEVTVFDRFHGHSCKNLGHLGRDFRMFPGELANALDVAKALEGQDLVYHCISITNPASSWGNPSLEVDFNLKYSLQLFELAARSRAGKVVFVSSGGTVYGTHPDLITEASLPRPQSPYGISKLAIEHFLGYFHAKDGLSADIYRVGNAYGRRQPYLASQGVVAVWMGQILRGMEVTVFGGESACRDYVHVKDIARLMTRSLQDPGQSDVYNLGTGTGTSLTQLLEMFLKLVPVAFRHRVLPQRPSDLGSVVLDSRKLTGCFPGFTFRTLEQELPGVWDYFSDLFVSDQGVSE